jgi:hypothetical protein
MVLRTVCLKSMRNVTERFCAVLNEEETICLHGLQHAACGRSTVLRSSAKPACLILLGSPARLPSPKKRAEEENRTPREVCQICSHLTTTFHTKNQIKYTYAGKVHCFARPFLDLSGTIALAARTCNEAQETVVLFPLTGPALQ